MFFVRNIKFKGDKGLKEMIENYRREAETLNRYRQILAQKIALETDPDRLRELELRKETVEAERFEMIEDIRAMASYIAARKNAE